MMYANQGETKNSISPRLYYTVFMRNGMETFSYIHSVHFIRIPNFF